MYENLKIGDLVCGRRYSAHEKNFYGTVKNIIDIKTGELLDKVTLNGSDYLNNISIEIEEIAKSFGNYTELTHEIVILDDKNKNIYKYNLERVDKVSFEHFTNLYFAHKQKIEANYKFMSKYFRNEIIDKII